MKKNVFITNFTFVVAIYGLIPCLILFGWFRSSVGEIGAQSSEKNKGNIASEEITQRKYLQMSKEKAQQLIKNIVAKGDVPRPSILSSWEIPADNIDVQGVEINKNDWLILARTKVPFVITLPSLLGLPEGFPKFVTTKYHYKEGSAARVYCSERGPEHNKDLIKKVNREIIGPFIHNYILCSSVDTILNQKIYERRDSWNLTDVALKKGCYLWLIGPGGVLLDRGDLQSMLIPFNKPLEGLSKQRFEKMIEDIKACKKPGGPDLYFSVDLSTEGKGVLLKFIGQELILK